MSLSRLLISGLFLILLSGFSYGENTDKKSTPNPTNKSEKGKGVTTYPVVISQPITTIIQKNESEESENNHHEIIGEVINISLVVITFGLALYTARLFRETKKLAESALEQGKDSRFHAQAELRAYVLITPAEKFHRQDARRNRPYVFSFYAKNEGKTPARNIRYKVGVRISEQSPLNKDFEKLEWEYNEPTAIMPNQIIMIDAESSFIFEPGLAKRVEEGRDKKSLLFFGKFMYDDIFGNIYTNRFCFQFRRTAHGFGWSIKGGDNSVE